MYLDNNYSLNKTRHNKHYLQKFSFRSLSTYTKKGINAERCPNRNNQFILIHETGCLPWFCFKIYCCREAWGVSVYWWNIIHWLGMKPSDNCHRQWEQWPENMFRVFSRCAPCVAGSEFIICIISPLYVLYKIVMHSHERSKISVVNNFTLVVAYSCTS